MRFFLVVYNLLLWPFLLLSFPAWLLTMVRRGGLGTGLLERLGLYERDVEFEPVGVVYVHAVSVGEVQMARKLISVWQIERPDQAFVLAATTATGHAIAKSAESDTVRVIYSPVDIRFITRCVLKRFDPKIVVLIESELWPNLISLVHAAGIPLCVANARLSERSHRRYLKMRRLVQPVLGLLDCVCVPEVADIERWHEIGVRREALHATGGLKYDQSGMPLPEKREEFQAMLNAFGQKRKIVLCASTFASEEEMLTAAIRRADRDFLPVLVPRHAERRHEVVSALQSSGEKVVLRSAFPEKVDKAAVFVIDSTGELRDWTAHADVVVIGKSWLAKGGQSPVEAISVRIPVVTGPHMKNFDGLMAELLNSGGIIQVQESEDLTFCVGELMKGARRNGQIFEAEEVLKKHRGAARRMVQAFLSRFE